VIHVRALRCLKQALKPSEGCLVNIAVMCTTALAVAGREVIERRSLIKQ
jgi:hypothetical protein